MHLLADIQWFGVFFGGFGGLFVLIGAAMAHTQSRKLRTYLSVPAVVKSAEVAVRSGDKGPTYLPKVHYTYTTPSGEHESSSTMAVEMSTSDRNWAARIIARYPAGTKTEAYVDPNDDNKVFLVHEASMMPYLWSMFCMIFVAIGMGVTMSNNWPIGWTTADRVLLVAIVWTVVGIGCLFHYRQSGGQLTLGPQIAFLFYGGLGLVGLFVWSDLRNQPPPKPPVARVAAVHRTPHRPTPRPTPKPLPAVER